MASSFKTDGGVIYLITNLVNGKYYVGQTKKLSSRKTQHLSAGRSGKAQFPVSRAIAKYGRNSFIFEEIGSASNQSSLDNLESLWILALSATDKRFGYNRRFGGSGSSCCAETLRLQSLAKLGKPNPKKGTGDSPEARRRKNAERNKRRRDKEKSERLARGVVPKKAKRTWSDEQRARASERAKKRMPIWGPHNPMPDHIRKSIAEKSRERVIADPIHLKWNRPPKQQKKPLLTAEERRQKAIEVGNRPEVRKKISEAKKGCKRPDNAERNRRRAKSSSATVTRRIVPDSPDKKRFRLLINMLDPQKRELWRSALEGDCAMGSKK